MGEIMKLDLINLKDYRITQKKLTGYRDMVTVEEIDITGFATGRSWSEPWDPIKGVIDELQSRFQNRINETPMIDEPLPTRISLPDLHTVSEAISSKIKDSLLKDIAAMLPQPKQTIIQRVKGLFKR